jgi:hypothetical protein
MKAYITFCFGLMLSLCRAQATVDAVIVNPNPFVSRTSILYSFTNNDTVTIKVYSTLGQAVLTLFTNSIMPSGSYQDSLIMDAFQPGVYLAVMSLGHRKNVTVKAIKMLPENVAEKSYSSSARIYPNPSNGTFFLEDDDSGDERKVSMTDCSGKIILEEEFRDLSERKYSITIKDKGIYFITVYLNGRKVTKKVTVF